MCVVSILDWRFVFSNGIFSGEIMILGNCKMRMYIYIYMYVCICIMGMSGVYEYDSYFMVF